MLENKLNNEYDIEIKFPMKTYGGRYTGEAKHYATRSCGKVNRTVTDVAETLPEEETSKVEDVRV